MAVKREFASFSLRVYEVISQSWLYMYWNQHELGNSLKADKLLRGWWRCPRTIPTKKQSKLTMCTVSSRSGLQFQRLWQGNFGGTIGITSNFYSQPMNLGRGEMAKVVPVASSYHVFCSLKQVGLWVDRDDLGAEYAFLFFQSAWVVASSEGVARDLRVINVFKY